MAKYLKKFETQAAYEAAEPNLILPNVSLTVDNDVVHYNPYVPPYAGFCKLTLKNGSTVELEGSGELTKTNTSAYSATVVSVEIGTQCTSIGQEAFYQYRRLTSVTISNSVTSIGEEAFEGSALISVTIGNSVTSIGYAAFKQCGLASIDIPSGVTSIGNSAFYYCDSLTSVTIGSGVTSIGEQAFYNCSGLTSIDIPNSVTSIGEQAFASCRGLTSITIPNSVTNIGNWAFGSCTGLTSVTIGNSVTNIGNGAFRSCSSLSTITSYIMNAPNVNSDTFHDVSNGGTLYVPIGSSGYDTWMNNQGNLGYHNWIKVEQ